MTRLHIINIIYIISILCGTHHGMEDSQGMQGCPCSCNKQKEDCNWLGEFTSTRKNKTYFLWVTHDSHIVSDIPSGSIDCIYIYIYIYYTYTLTFYLIWFLAYTLTFYLIFFLAFYMASVLLYFLACNILIFFLAFYLTSILTLLYLAFCLTFYRASSLPFFLTFYLAFSQKKELHLC